MWVCSFNLHSKLNFVLFQIWFEIRFRFSNIREQTFSIWENCFLVFQKFFKVLQRKTNLKNKQTNNEIKLERIRLGFSVFVFGFAIAIANGIVCSYCSGRSFKPPIYFGCSVEQGMRWNFSSYNLHGNEPKQPSNQPVNQPPTVQSRIKLKNVVALVHIKSMSLIKEFLRRRLLHTHTTLHTHSTTCTILCDERFLFLLILDISRDFQRFKCFSRHSTLMHTNLYIMWLSFLRLTFCCYRCGVSHVCVCACACERVCVFCRCRRQNMFIIAYKFRIVVLSLYWNENVTAKTERIRKCHSTYGYS